jgi:hypothetical protein
LVTAVLLPGSRRSPDRGDFNFVRVPSRTANIRLEVDLGEDHHSGYAALIQDPDGKISFPAAAIERHATGVEVRIWVFLPSDKVPDGEYILRVSGTDGPGKLENVGDYVFNIVRNGRSQ